MPTDRSEPLEERARAIARRLIKEYPGANVALDFSTPLQLLVAAILAAQCTDERVNRVTPALFKRYPAASDYADADPDELEALVRPTGFYRNKALSIRNCCRALVDDFGGAVPRTMDELTRLPGIGRKTANMLLTAAFGEPGIVVDRHVKRVALRLELAASENPDKIEAELGALIPQSQWVDISYAMLEHGRRVCTARRPRHEECVVRAWCSYPEKNA